MDEMVSLEEAYQWLSHGRSSRLSPSTRQIVEQMNQALKTQRYREAWNRLERLRQVSEMFTDGLEEAEALVESGRAAFQMGNCQEAIQFLEKANQSYATRRHESALVQWMLGFVLWQQGENPALAVNYWRRAIDAFVVLARQRYFPNFDPAWYAEKRLRMQAALECALDQDYLPFAPAPAPAKPTLPPPDWAAALSDSLSLFPVSEQVPAGGFGPVGYDPYVKTFVEIDRVLIDDIPHRVVNLRDGGQARLAFAQNYFVIQVTGDSMNRASLEEGDYALVKVQEQAADQDIVLAEIAGVDGVIATLKRFVRQGKQIILKPDSTNPRHSPLPFSSNDQELKIRGVVLAVFKRI